MKLSIDRTALLTALTRVSGIVGRRNVIPILSNVLLDAADDQLVIRATDLDLEARVAVTCRVSEPGAITTPAASLLDIAKATAEGAEIGIALEDGRLKVNAGRARWKLPVLPAGDFPAFDGEDWEWSGEFAGAGLADLLKRIAWAPKPSSKPFSAGVHLSCDGPSLIARATDLFQFVTATIPCNRPEFAGVIVPTRTANEIARMAGDDGGTLMLSTRRVGFEGLGSLIRSRVIAYEYPVDGFNRLFGLERESVVAAPVADILAACRRALIGMDMAYLKLDFRPGALSVSARAANSTEGDDEVEVGYLGEPITLGVNGNAVISMLGTIRGDEAEIVFGNDREPFVIRAPGDSSVMCGSSLARV